MQIRDGIAKIVKKHGRPNEVGKSYKFDAGLVKQ
jgi:hypothetical protein